MSPDEIRAAWRARRKGNYVVSATSAVVGAGTVRESAEVELRTADGRTMFRGSSNGSIPEAFADALSKWRSSTITWIRMEPL